MMSRMGANGIPLSAPLSLCYVANVFGPVKLSKNGSDEATDSVDEHVEQFI